MIKMLMSILFYQVVISVIMWVCLATYYCSLCRVCLATVSFLPLETLAISSSFFNFPEKPYGRSNEGTCYIKPK